MFRTRSYTFADPVDGILSRSSLWKLLSDVDRVLENNFVELKDEKAVPNVGRDYPTVQSQISTMNTTLKQLTALSSPTS